MWYITRDFDPMFFIVIALSRMSNIDRFLSASLHPKTYLFALGTVLRVYQMNCRFHRLNHYPDIQFGLRSLDEAAHTHTRD